jgi:cystathionine beta-lyase/cystathionine gamma-synthase
MQTVTFDSVSLDELDGSFIKALKTLFLGHRLRITVEPEMTETEYLNSSSQNRSILEERIKAIESKENVITFSSVSELRQALEKI